MFLKSAFCLNCDLYMRTRTQNRDVLVALLFGLTFKDAPERNFASYISQVIARRRFLNL